MLKDKINEDIKSAMKSGDQLSLDVLRGLNAAFNNKSIEKRGKGLSEELSDEERLEILNKEVKKRKDAIVLYNQGNRKDLAEREEKEAALIQKYLPAQMTREEVEKIIIRTIETLRPFGLAQGGQAQGDIAFGDVMKEVMKELKGKADAQIISDIVKEKI